METWCPKKVGLGFAFDNIKYSDRVLCLHIVSAFGYDFKLKKIHICSLVVASKSGFFYKLFKNWKGDTLHKDEVTLRINTSEESALMDLLKFMYGLPMSATSAQDLVDVLMASEKFEAPLCIKNCVDLLLELPMSIETALLYLGLVSSVSEGELVLPLIDSVKEYLSGCYSNFTEYQEELLGLPLPAIEIVLGLDGLRVDSEDAVLDFILKWARLHYPKHEERREILSKHLIKFVCISSVSSLKIKEVLNCSEFDYKELPKLVLDAVLSPISTEHDSPRRVYTLMPIQEVQLELTPPRCLVHLDIKKQHCADLNVLTYLRSQEFRLGGRALYLLVQCIKDEQNSVGLYVQTTESCTLDFAFAVMKKSSQEFETVSKNVGGFPGLILTSWNELMSEESEYFIDGILHLRADITLLS